MEAELQAKGLIGLEAEVQERGLFGWKAEVQEKGLFGWETETVRYLEDLEQKHTDGCLNAAQVTG